MYTYFGAGNAFGPSRPIPAGSFSASSIKSTCNSNSIFPYV